jgi:hypothetical protein
MSEEPRDLILPILRQMREEMQNGFADMKLGIAELNLRMSGVESQVAALNTEVAALAVSNRHIRADVAQLLAESGEFARRIKRLEDHLGLPPLN